MDGRWVGYAPTRYSAHALRTSALDEVEVLSYAIHRKAA